MQSKERLSRNILLGRTGQCGSQRLEKDHDQVCFSLPTGTVLEHGETGAKGNPMAGWFLLMTEPRCSGNC